MNQNEYIQNLLKEQKYQEVLGLLQKQLAYNDDAATRAMMAQCQYRLGNFTASVEELNRAIQFSPAHAQFYSDRGVSNYMLGKRQEALEDFNQAQQLEPQNPYRYSSRAYVKDAFGDTEGAVADYQQSLALDPEDAIAYNNLGLLLEKLGYRQQAQEHFQKADELNGIPRPHPQPLPDIMPESSKKQKAAAVQPPAPKPQMSLPFFVQTFRSVFTSRSGFRDFLQYLFGKKSDR